jgi:hypothetical protein
VNARTTAAVSMANVKITSSPATLRQRELAVGHNQGFRHKNTIHAVSSSTAIKTPNIA